MKSGMCGKIDNFLVENEGVHDGMTTVSCKIIAEVVRTC